MGGGSQTIVGAQKRAQMLIFGLWGGNLNPKNEHKAHFWS